jgi:hypothetical protein
MRSLLLFAGLGLLGCDNRSLYDQMTSGGGCHADDSLSSVIGVCPNDLLACSYGLIDADGILSNGCERLIEPSDKHSLFALGGAGLAVMDINEYRMTATAVNGEVAIAGPTCEATPSTPCQYTLLTLQIRLSEFTFDSLYWGLGLIELPKPMSVTDNGDGLIIPAGSEFIASFLIDHQKHVISHGKSQGSVQLSSNQAKANVQVGGDLRFPFGGYTVEGMSIKVNGSLLAPQ